MRKVKMYAIRPDSERGYMTHISDSLENLQRFVEGYIETVTIAEDVLIICNEEGRLNDMDFCCEICGIMFYGPVLITGYDGGDLADVPLSTDEIRRWLGVK